MIGDKKTKIVATLGPATTQAAEIGRLIKAGMNVARLNFSHGQLNDHYQLFTATRQAAERLKTPIAILQDLTGPKLRLGDLAEPEVKLEPGRQLVLTTRPIAGSDKIISVNYNQLPAEVKAGDRILLNDGRQELSVLSTDRQTITTKIIRGGVITSRRGINVPGVHLSLPSLTAKDKRDLAAALDWGIDYVAVSFVRQASDIKNLKRRLAKSHPEVKVIAKIETAEAIADLDNIIAAADGIMIARGDLAIEVPPEEVPILQKQIITKCNNLGRPVITATQMLESMTRQVIPTRAEVNDVANAIFDGTDAVMLSEETATGQYPVLATELMQKIACQTEQSLVYNQRLIGSHLTKKGMAEAFSWAALSMAHDLDAAWVVALSQSGFTARQVSRFRPKRPLVVLTSNHQTYRQLALSFGCDPVLVREIKSSKQMMAEVRRILLAKKLAKSGQVALIVAGMPYGVSGTTNMLLAETI